MLPLKTLVLPLALMAISAPAGAAIVLSEDFSGGNPVNATDYALASSGAFTGQAQYRVISNPATTFTNGYDSYFDHTLGTAAGSMEFFDGSANAANRIWYSSINLTSGTLYTLSFWKSAADATNLPTLQVLVDGVAVGSVQNATDGKWTQSSVSFTPTSGSSHTIAIVDTQTIGLGNDGALDDIVLVSVPEPASLAILGLPMAALLARRRRR